MREVTSSAKRSSVADGGYGCGGDLRAKAGNLAQPPATRIVVATVSSLS
jgi:hypothetical protein